MHTLVFVEIVVIFAEYVWKEFFFHDGLHLRVVLAQRRTRKLSYKFGNDT